MPYYKLIASRILTNAKAVHYTSEDEYLNVHERLGLKNSALIVPNGIVMDEYSNLPKKGEFIKLYPDLKDKQILLYLGRLSWKKGIDLIIKSLPSILDRNKNAHLVIAGNEEDNYKNELRTLFLRNQKEIIRLFITIEERNHYVKILIQKNMG